MPASSPFLLCLPALVLVLIPVASGSPDHTDFLGDPLPEGAVARFGSTRLRHVGPVEGLAWSPDDKLIATCGRWDRTIRLWDTGTGRLVRSFPTGKGSAFCLTFTPDGKALAGGLDGVAYLWQANTGKELLRL